MDDVGKLWLEQLDIKNKHMGIISIFQLSSNMAGIKRQLPPRRENEVCALVYKSSVIWMDFRTNIEKNFIHFISWSKC